MIEQIVLGIIQGVAEWLPVSSEGMLVLAKTNFFDSGASFEDAVKHALFLHFGTFLAALIYFHKDVAVLCKGLFSFKTQSPENKNLITFLIISTLISGVLGICLLKLVSELAMQFDPHGNPITPIIGVLLLGTGFLELKAKKNSGYRELNNIKMSDAIILGIVQGLAALPGFSRSGFTVSALLLLKFDKACALKLSFLMSMPIVLGGNIVLHASELSWNPISLIGLGCATAFGLLTIHLLLKVAEKINFGIFVIIFGLLTILSAFV